MATIEIRQDNSVIVSREFEHCFNNDFENVIRPVKDDKTFIIAELLTPQIRELMSKDLNELQELHLKMVRQDDNN